MTVPSAFDLSAVSAGLLQTLRVDAQFQRAAPPPPLRQVFRMSAPLQGRSGLQRVHSHVKKPWDSRVATERTQLQHRHSPYFPVNS